VKLAILILAASCLSAATVYPTNAPFGAKCDGISDDAPAIQTAINSLGAAGGTVHLNACAKPYLLNSFYPGINSEISYNLLIGSNVTLEGDPGAELLQGPKGLSLAANSGTVTLAFSNGDNSGCFQDTAAKCKTSGFIPIQATTAASTAVTLSTPSQTSIFSAGDYVMIYAYTTYPAGGGILPGEPNVITAVKAGVFTLKYPMARSFSSPYIVRVTPAATWNVGLSGLIVKGWWPIQLYGVFGASIQGNTFTLDETNEAHAHLPEIASSRGVLFSNDTINATFADVSGLQVPDQSGMNITFSADTFNVNGADFGSEYAAYVSVINSHFFITNNVIAVGVITGGVDAVFVGNDVHGGTASTSGLPVLLTDYSAGGSYYAAFNTNIYVANNIFDCTTPTLAYCIYTVLGQTTLVNNQISVSGPKTIGIMMSAGGSRTAISQTAIGNQVTTVTGPGIYVGSAGTDAATIVGNTVKTGNAMCIEVEDFYLTALETSLGLTSDQGADIIAGNTGTGCTTPVSINMSMHPGAVVQ
jgi:hypothetical protein